MFSFKLYISQLSVEIVGKTTLNCCFRCISIQIESWFLSLQSQFWQSKYKDQGSLDYLELLVLTKYLKVSSIQNIIKEDYPFYHPMLILCKSIIIIMSQLSSLSQSAINKLRTFLTLVQKFISQIHRILFVKIPQLSADVAYSFSVLMDISTFLPSYLYKAIAALILFVFIRRKIKKYLSQLDQKRETNKKEDEIPLQQSQLFGSLGQEFQVKKNVPNTEVCNTPEQQDSCCQDLSKQLQKQPRDFRDVVFFQLMDGYRKSLKKKSKPVPKQQRE